MILCVTQLAVAGTGTVVQIDKGLPLSPSPLLANIALTGLLSALKLAFPDAGDSMG
jgi:hypothetical protein